MRITAQILAEMSCRIGHFAAVSVGVDVRAESVVFTARAINAGVIYSAERAYSFAEIEHIVSTVYLVNDFVGHARKELDAVIPKPWLHVTPREDLKC